MSFKGGLGNLMKQAQEMQAKMQQAQKEIAQMTITGESGAGLVRIEMNGQHKAKRVQIDPSLAKPDEIEVLEDLIVAAFNSASQKVEEASRQKLSGLTAGLDLPPDLLGGDGSSSN